jgi:hypothetical protein
MPILAELYVAARTRNVEDADTDDLPVFVVRRGSSIVFSKPLFGGSTRVSRGAGAVWRMDVRESNLDDANLTFELHASGDDAWAPEHVIVWGTSGRIGEEIVIPMAAFLDLASPVSHPDAGTWISTDTSEGDRVLFIPAIGRGLDSTRAQRIIVVTATDPYGGMFPAAVGPPTSFEDQGTSASLTLQAGAPGKLLLSYTLPATKVGGNLRRGEGAFFVADLAAHFSRQDLQGGALTLTIDEFDQWVPDYFAVFGIGPTLGRAPRVLIPFVAATGFQLKIMSSDPGKGFHSAILPMARVLREVTSPDAVDPDDLGGVLAARIVPHPEDLGPPPGTAGPKA